MLTEQGRKRRRGRKAGRGSVVVSDGGALFFPLLRVPISLVMALAMLFIIA